MGIPRWLQPLSRAFRRCIKGVRRLWCRMAFWRASECRPIGVTLGRYVRGADGLWIGGDGEAVLPLAQLEQHVVMLGTDPDGKNRVASLLLEGIAGEDRRAQLFCLDSDADPEMAALFDAATVMTGRHRFFFPEQPFNVWAGDDWRFLSSRLNETQAGPAAHDTSATSRILQLACRVNDELPRSQEELFKRLNRRTLFEAHGAERLRGISSEQVDGVYMRCKAVFAYLGTALDGEVSFGDLDAAYFSFDRLTMGWSAGPTIRMLLSQLIDYIRHEKDPGRPCVVLIRVPATLVGDANQAALLEHARKNGVVLVWILDTLAGAGNATQVSRTLHGAGTLIGHSRLLWTELNAMISPGGPMEVVNSVPAGSRSKVSREDLLGLSPGHALVVSKGAATLVDVPPPTAS